MWKFVLGLIVGGLILFFAVIYFIGTLSYRG